MRFLVLVAMAWPLAALAERDADTQREIQRALIERDRQSADFARGVESRPLPPHVGQPLHADPVVARELRPYERQRENEQGFVLRLPPPENLEAEKPLPLPRGPRHGVEPVTPDGVSG